MDPPRNLILIQITLPEKLPPKRGALFRIIARILKCMGALISGRIAPTVSKWSADRWLFFLFQVGLFIFSAVVIIIFFAQHISILFGAEAH
jgi:hypothetical protein